MKILIEEIQVPGASGENRDFAIEASNADHRLTAQVSVPRNQISDADETVAIGSFTMFLEEVVENLRSRTRIQ
jgi:hypothetical protein